MIENKVSKIQFRQGTLTDWATANPILASGEPGYILEGGFKIGDGVTRWNNLPLLGSTNLISDVPNDGKEYLRIYNNWVSKDEAKGIKDLLRKPYNTEIDMNYTITTADNQIKEVYGIRFKDIISTTNPREVITTQIQTNVTSIIDFNGYFVLGNDSKLSLNNSCVLGYSYMFIDEEKNLKVITCDNVGDRNSNIIEGWVIYTK